MQQTLGAAIFRFLGLIKGITRNGQIPRKNVEFGREQFKKKTAATERIPVEIHANMGRDTGAKGMREMRQNTIPRNG